MDVSTIQTIVATTGGMGGVGGIMAMLNHRAAKRQMNNAAKLSVVEMAKDFNEMALALLDPLRKRADEAESQVKAIEGQLIQVKEVVVSLSDTNRKALAELDEMRVQLAIRDAELTVYRRSEPPS